MRLSFLVNEVAGGWSVWSDMLGGTEEMVVAHAEELAKRGHQVTVYHNTDTKYGVLNGVTYKPRMQFETGDFCFNIKSSEIKPQGPTVYVTNEYDATSKDLSAYDAVMWPSQWADDNIPVNNPRRFIVPHGYHKERIYPSEKVPKQCLYASSPDRGLDVLLRAWPKVYDAHPDATLIISYGAEEIEYPGITYVGRLSDEELAPYYQSSDIWVHPCTGIELFCITGIKAQVAGCVPVIIPAMALAETVKHGYFTDDPDSYADTLIKALDDSSGRELMRQQLAKEYYPDWGEATDVLEKAMNDILRSWIFK